MNRPGTLRRIGEFARRNRVANRSIPGAAVPLLVLIQPAGSARLPYSSTFIWQDGVSVHNLVAVPALASKRDFSTATGRLACS